MRAILNKGNPTVSGLALVLVLIAAVIHATWNLLAKKAGGGPPFVWLYGATSAVLYTPVYLLFFLFHPEPVGRLALLFIAGSGLIHLAYFLLLQHGYDIGDLSLIYPLARGTGPLLSAAAAIAFFGERPSAIAIAGALLVAASIFLFAQPPKDSSLHFSKGVVFGLVIGVLIACYTLWDKRGVGTYGIAPLLMEFGTILGRAVFLAPVAARNWDDVARQWRTHRREIFWIGLLNPLAYLLVLYVMISTPVSYVAPAREVSILIGTVFGAKLLSESGATRRILAASAMVAGIAALALG
ncbi:MAG TPA: DMT family transporter [Bryobacteraceae bacterium]|nr:DMT family transporter [Bryobacteraceae bacterium]